MPRFAANLSWLYAELPWPERFAAAAADGFTAVEILSSYAWPIDTLKAWLSAHAFQLVLINAPPGGTDAASIAAAWASPLKGTACVPGREAEFDAGITLALQYAAALGCPRIHVMAGVLPDGVDRAAAQTTYIDNLRRAAAEADGAGIDLMIEPINLRDIPGFFLNRQDHAHELIDAIGSTRVKVQLDLYHCQIVEGDLAMTLRRHLPTGRIGHVQIAGVPGRNEPDLGEVNYPYLFALLDELGFDGWVGCEYRPVRGAAVNATTDGLGWLRAQFALNPFTPRIETSG